MKQNRISLFKFVTLIALGFISFLSFTQNIEWQKSLGGTGLEEAFSIQPVSSGGYIFTGSTTSNDGDVSGNQGSKDVWVVKLNTTGGIEWQKTYGGTSDEYGTSIQPTADGGYILLGVTKSNDGDVNGNHGGEDVWVVKLDSIGTIEWQKCFGGTDDDMGNYIITIPTGGYILTGYTYSNDGDVSGLNHGYTELLLVKLYSDGSIQWKKCIGGTVGDFGYAIQATLDGGYILTGGTSSNDGDISGNHLGSNDALVIKVDSIGTIQWQKCYGGTDHLGDTGLFIQVTPDGGYILASSVYSTDGDVIGNHGEGDIWVVKLNSTGGIEWQNALGGTSWESPTSIQVTPDSGFILSGYTRSNDGDVSGNHAINPYTYDAWIVKLTAIGGLEWQKCLGGTSFDYGYFIQNTSDGGYILAGSSDSNDGDVSGNHNSYDVWIVKLNTTLSILDSTVISYIKAYPNPISEENITISYHLSKSTSINVSIVDVLGNIVFAELYDIESVGLHQKKMNLENLGSGVYFLQLQTEYGVCKTQIVKY